MREWTAFVGPADLIGSPGFRHRQIALRCHGPFGDNPRFLSGKYKPGQRLFVAAVNEAQASCFLQRSRRVLDVAAKAKPRQRSVESPGRRIHNRTVRHR